MTLFVDYDGWYKDHQGTRQRLSKEVMRVVQTMKVGQKVLIVEEKEDRNPEVEKDDRGKEARIWLVYFSACLSAFADTIIGLSRCCRYCRSIQATLAFRKMSLFTKPPWRRN